MPMPEFPVSSESYALRVVNCAAPLQAETDRVFSEGYSTYSLAAYQPNQETDREKAALDLGFGTHIREAVEMVKDWTK